MNFFVYYRISDNSRLKEKLPIGDKSSCLLNALCEFGTADFHIIADNCSSHLVDFIAELTAQSGHYRGGGVTMEITSLGNSASCMYMIDNIIKKHNIDDKVYLIEDDYIHRTGSMKVLLEGLEIADYVTLYDHPDKYWLEADHGNPFNFKKLQKTRIYTTQTTHWRETNAATMTFACSVKTLQADYNIWKKFCSMGKTPKDFHAFLTITQNNISDMISFFLRGKKRRGECKILLKNALAFRRPKKLISPIPSYATHTEIAFLAPFIEWEKIIQDSCKKIWQKVE